MANTRRLYIDAEGVKRGYYVYIHRDLSNNEVFYVGKGSGKRAWSTTSRSRQWYDKVASLENRWEVEIVQEDLCENEAFDLESQLVEKYGGGSVSGGILANIAPGGENPLSFQLSVAFDDRGWSEFYYKARKFKELSREKQEAFAQHLNDALETLISDIDSIKTDAEKLSDEMLQGNVDDLDYFVVNLRCDIMDFMRRRISWKQLGIQLEEIVDDIEYEFEDDTKYKKVARSLLRKVLRIASKALKTIDSGNRAEAESTADRSCKKH